MKTLSCVKGEIKCFRWIEALSCTKMLDIETIKKKLDVVKIIGGEVRVDCFNPRSLFPSINQVSQQYHIEYQLFLIDSFYG